MMVFILRPKIGQTKQCIAYGYILSKTVKKKKSKKVIITKAKTVFQTGQMGGGLNQGICTGGRGNW